MKITIDLSTLENLDTAKKELADLDNQLMDLIANITTAKEDSQASVARQLFSILDRVQNIPETDKNLERQVKTYAEGYINEVLMRLIAPHRREILSEITALQNKAIAALHVKGASGHMNARSDIINNYDMKIVTDIEKQVREALETVFAEHFEPEKV